MLSVEEVEEDLELDGSTGTSEYALFDRGDAPALAVLDKNARTVAARISDETRDELARVMSRVDNIYCAFEEQDSLYSSSTRANLEYISSMNELEDIMKDQVKKRKYQQQVTVFIVGYQSVSTQKFKLLQQINEFFIDNTNFMDREQEIEPEEIDLDILSSSIEQSMDYALSLTSRMADINREIIEFAAVYAQGKGGKGRRKMEKALGSARDDIAALNDKLARAQMDIQEKEEKIQGLYKTVEMRTLEAQRFKTAAEAAKKSVSEADRLRIELAKHEEKIASLTLHLDKMEYKYAETTKQRQDDREKIIEDEVHTESRMRSLDETMHHQQDHFDRVTSDLMRKHDKEIADLQEKMNFQIATIQNEHQLGTKTLEDKIEELTKQLAGAQMNERDSTGDMRCEPAESARQDGSRGLDADDLTDDVDLTADEELWETVPHANLAARFKQYRYKSQQCVSDLERRIEELQEKMQRKVTSLKAQYSDHKTKWDMERSTLLQQVAISDVDNINKDDEESVDHRDKNDGQSRVKTATGEIRPTATDGEDDITADAGSEHEMDIDSLLKQTDDAKVQELMKSSTDHFESEEDEQSSTHVRGRKSTASSLHSVKSMISGLDEDVDIDLPNDEEDMEGYANPSTLGALRTPSGHAMGLADHPVVQEFIKLYNVIVMFKDRVSSTMTEHSQCLTMLDKVTFSNKLPVQDQLESMTRSASEIVNIITEILRVYSNGYLPSSIGTSKTLEQGQISVLQQQVKRLEQIVQDSNEKYERDLSQSRAKIVKLEEKNAYFKRELSTLGRTIEDDTPEGQEQDSDVPIMFTRLDMERNGKIMKRAMNNDKLHQDKYKEALETMDSYISIPAKRFAHLVRKYVHHRQMKEIEENVKNSRSLNDSVFQILDKMEGLQNMRAHRWADYMDSLSAERLNLAQLLMKTLDDIEQESGIFLIKPMYSLKGRDPVSCMYSKYAHRHSAARRRSPTVLKTRPVQTTPRQDQLSRPTSNKMGYSAHTERGRPGDIPLTSRGDLMNSKTTMSSSILDMGSIWVAPLSEAHRRRFDEQQAVAMLNTPRILELDINRMLISQNAISARLNSTSSGEHGNVLRSYVTINRPQATSLHRDKALHSIGSPRNDGSGANELVTSSLPPINATKDFIH